MRLSVLWLILVLHFDAFANYKGKVECASDASSTVEATTVISEHREQGSTAVTAMTEVVPDTVTTRGTPKPWVLDTVRAFMAKNMASAGSGFARKLLHADISSECSIGILQFMRAIKDLEPWAVRMIDASAKIPIGLFQTTVVEFGAYDECIETVVRNEDGTDRVRAQYCNLHVKSGGDLSVIEEFLPMFEMSHKRAANFSAYLTDDRLPGFRLGICVMTDCTERDLQEIANTFVGGIFKVTVRNCVTSQDEDINTAQIIILAVLGTIAVTVIVGTALDVFLPKEKQNERLGCLMNCMTAFSLVKNTKFLFGAHRTEKSDTYVYGFVHGLRFFGIFWIVLGHSYASGIYNSSRVINALEYFEHWYTLIVTFGYQAVDTFFFLSGFFIYFKLDKENGNVMIVTVIAIVRRFIRVTVPTFFMIMCIYILPLVASGPNSKEFYSRFYDEIRDHWWDLLFLVRNWREDFIIPILAHLWYISTDFQLFIVSVLVIQFLKRIYLETMNKSYTRPFYHGVCFFSGCMTFLAVQKYGTRRLSKVFQAACWCAALFCGLFCLFVRHLWYRSDGRASEPTRMAHAFTDRILWSVCVAWFMFACATSRAGPLSRFLSWEGLLPLSRLSFGAYLLHVPIQTLSYFIARERTFFSHYTLVSSCFAAIIWSYVLSYLMFIACEGPTANLEALLFVRRKRKQSECKSADLNGNRMGDRKLQMCFQNKAARSPAVGSGSIGIVYRL
ncbi:nose resistant to fluoxetine protein 6-like isoform X2 [Dermacentor silvarum]|uniref:nose resistant to fluoxetine protein 6-like isoform X2 n=1 Tax=Dermacentor silvarum TaxID=543639 RepID=UPI0021011CD3|nr:nose resistant to fluoxetine protein 6-like isoform X2 [Dermacentor silvarum]